MRRDDGIAGSGLRRIVRHEELPVWARDNEFITTGYRAPGGTRAQQRRDADGIVGAQNESAIASSKGRNSNGLRQRGKFAIDAANIQTGDTDAIYEHDSFLRCWYSVWGYVHNESVNIHTHLWGGVVAVVVLGLHVVGAQGQIPRWLHPIAHHAIFYPSGIDPIPTMPREPTSLLNTIWSSVARQGKPQLAISAVQGLGSLVSSPGYAGILPRGAAEYRPNEWKDVAGFGTFLFGAITVFTCSATFHTVSCHSKEISHSFNKLDYIGIVAMIVGSFLPMLHYGFYCHAHLQLFYSIAVSSLGCFATYTVLSRKYATPAYRPVRTSVFVALGLSAIFPVAHILAMYGHDAVSRTMGLDYLVAGGALYIIGAGLYVARIPERLSPGTFDYFGASHQIFHILILVAAFCHYVCIRRAYCFWHTVEALDAASPGGKQTQHAVAAVCNAFEQLRQSAK